ncbi:UNVERIFIED_ORG: anti-anti-sigma factor [Actinomadura viridilutea]|uniref:STAS domain-containing protein n=1 Tax=Actinomadura rubrobrunea TaxID=115335 RepID=UPI000AF8E4E5|nr:STAS domain-containing protein [Actinomadura rubrobrunea]
MNRPSVEHRPWLETSLTFLPDETRLLSVAGELDIATADFFRRRLLAALHLDRPRVVVDAGRLDFCDGRGLDALTAAGDLAEALGGRVTIVNPRPQLAKLLQITGLSRRFAAAAAAPSG